jgi:hypothetical protein
MISIEGTKLLEYFQQTGFEKLLESFQQPSFGGLPLEVNLGSIFLRLNPGAIRSLLSTNKYLYVLLSMKEMQPLWDEFLMRYFPDSFHMYQRNLTESVDLKSLFKQFLKSTNNMHNEKYEIKYLYPDQKKLELSTQHQLVIHLVESDNKLSTWKLATGERVKTIANPFQNAVAKDDELFLLNNGVIEQLKENKEDMKCVKEFVCFSLEKDSDPLTVFNQFKFRFITHLDLIISTYFVGGKNKSAIKIWEIETGSEYGFFEIETGAVSALAACENLIYIGLNNGIILIWDLEKKCIVRNLQNSKEIVRIVVNSEFLCFNDVGEMNFLHQHESDVVIWSLNEGLPVTKLKSPFIEENIKRINVHDHHLYVLIQNYIGYSIKIWNFRTGKMVTINPGVYFITNDFPITSFRIFEGFILLQLNGKNYKFLDFIIDVKSQLQNSTPEEN